MNAKDVKHFEERLLAERERLMTAFGNLQESIRNAQRDGAGDQSAYASHMADQGTDSMEREKQFLFASAEGRELTQIEEALGRVYRSEYGYCLSCRGPIARPRLEVVPHAELCITCKEKQERTRGTEF